MPARDAFTAAAVTALVVVPLAAQAASPVLTVAEVRDLITRPDCGGIDAGTPEGAALRDRMVAKFRQESGFNPLAVRVEDENRGIMDLASKDAAAAEAMRRIERGQTLGLGLGQVTGTRNLLADFGAASVADAVRLAFQPCAAVRASVRHYAADLRHAMRVMDCASAAYNAGPARTCQDTGYVRSVRALQAALPSAVPDVATFPLPRRSTRRPPVPASTVEVLLPVPVDPVSAAITAEGTP